MMRRLIDFALCPVCREEKRLIHYSADRRKICTKCGSELITIKLKDADYEDGRCPFCGEERHEEQNFFRNYYVVIFKCKKCGRFDGYVDSDENDNFHFDYFELSDKQYPRKTMKIAEKEGKPIMSASAVRKITKEINKKAKNPKQKCQNLLTNLIKEKRKDLEEASVNQEVLENAIARTRYSIQKNGPFTEKQLKILYPAAILAAQETLIQKGSKNRKKTNERQLEKLFNVDRKTLRKWKRTLL